MYHYARQVFLQISREEATLGHTTPKAPLSAGNCSISQKSGTLASDISIISRKRASWMTAADSIITRIEYPYGFVLVERDSIGQMVPQRYCHVFHLFSMQKYTMIYLRPEICTYDKDLWRMMKFYETSASKTLTTDERNWLCQ